MVVLRLIIIQLFLNVYFNCFGQLSLNQVDYAKIEQKKIRDYIESQKEANIIAVSDIEPSVTPESNISGLRSIENEYLIKDSIENVWDCYTQLNPAKTWNGKKATFGFLFSQKEKRIIYVNDTINGIQTGQVIYLNLKLLKGIKNIATAFELTKIDNKNRIIEISYLKGNSSIGKQRIQFFETPKGKTYILHTSYYKCRNIVKNYVLYSFFHTRLINEYHRNMRKYILD